MPGDVRDGAEVERRDHAVVPRAVLHARRDEAGGDQRRDEAEIVEHVERGGMEGRGAGFLAQLRRALEHGDRNAGAHEGRRRDEADRAGARDENSIFRDHRGI